MQRCFLLNERLRVASFLCNERHSSLDPRSLIQWGWRVRWVMSAAFFRHDFSATKVHDIHATRDGMLLAKSSPFCLRGTPVIRSTVAQPCGGLNHYYSRSSWYVFGFADWKQPEIALKSQQFFSFLRCLFDYYTEH